MWGLRLTLLLAFFALQSFAGDVKSFFAKNVDMKPYKSYSWLPPRLATNQGVQDGDPVIAPLVKAAVNKQLIAKGLTEVPENGDLTIVSMAMQSGMYQFEGFLVMYGFDAYWGVPYGMVSPVQRYNKEGTLAVALVDSKTKKGMWVGIATEALGKQSMVPGALEKAATRMFKKYPK